MALEKVQKGLKSKLVETLMDMNISWRSYAITLSRLLMGRLKQVESRRVGMVGLPNSLVLGWDGGLTTTGKRDEQSLCLPVLV
jgi:hypothetical protein